MSVSSTSSPMSAASPQNLVPVTSSTMNKPLAPMPDTLPTPSIFTNKEWIIPPRPKPGRKPAADTPPTKRKAQNRAAQRAFRERRAARVGELEEQMKQMEEEDEKEQEELRSRINQLETEMENYNHLLLSWREKYQKLEMDLNKEQQLRKTAETELYLLRNTPSSSTEAVPLPPRTTKTHPQDPPLQNQLTSQQQPPFSMDVPMGCGKCTKDTHCECIEALASLSCGKCTKDSHCECIAQAFDTGNILPPDTSSIPFKRSHSPSSTTDGKRTRYTTSNGGTETEATEIDFTSHFSSRPPPPTLPTATTTSSMPSSTQALPDDSCGFCQDGTPCICAEMAADAAKLQNPNIYSKSQQPTLTKQSISSTCINGPGTCAQCQSSASSTLFCKSLAATRPLRTFPPNPNPYPSTHPTPPTSTSQNTDLTQAITGPTLSCAKAYQTISQHPAFPQASEELGAWIPDLRTVPGGSRGVAERSMEGLTAFEVEAASVMGVLKFFDRRFGRGVD